MAIIVKMGHVEETTTDPAGGLRIKARTKQDGSSELPWAFPLMPKQFQVVPKVGEGVFIINEDDKRKDSNRYYIGPIIPQPQYNTKSEFQYGRGEALACLDGRAIEALGNISNDSRTDGSFPEIGDVSVVGRDSQDMIMRHTKEGSDEVVLRCGIRKEDVLANIGSRKEGTILNVGKIIFNNLDPAYIQMKYKENLGTLSKNYDAKAGEKISQSNYMNSAINIVADKINIVGVRDTSINVEKAKNKSLISDADMDEMMSQLHQLPKGDVLVKFLKLLCDAFLSHVHNYNGLPPVVADYVLSVKNFDLNDILSTVVRIS